jgi:hypothetical protein
MCRFLTDYCRLPCCLDGCRPDVVSLRAVLDEVAQCNRDSFSLHRHLCATDVRLDWPLYSDDDRLALTRLETSHRLLIDLRLFVLFVLILPLLFGERFLSLICNMKRGDW